MYLFFFVLHLFYFAARFIELNGKIDEEGQGDLGDNEKNEHNDAPVLMHPDVCGGYFVSGYEIITSIGGMGSVTVAIGTWYGHPVDELIVFPAGFRWRGHGLIGSEGFYLYFEFGKGLLQWGMLEQ